MTSKSRFNYAWRLLPALLIFIAIPIAQAADWPQWRGPDADGISKEKGLIGEWPEGGPEVAWEIENAGVGYSSLAIVDGRIITQGDLGGVEHILAFSEKDGSLLWAVQPGPVGAKLDAKVDEDFARHDKNADGKLDDVEAIAGLGAQQAFKSDSAEDGDAIAIAADRAARFLKAFDKDADGSLTVTEIPAQIAREASNIDRPARGGTEALAEKRTEQLLAALDGDNDGQLSRDELKGTIVQQWSNNIDKRDGPDNKGDGLLTREELQAYFSIKEKGKDGVLTSEEIAGFFAKSYPGRDGLLSKSDLKSAIGGYRNGQGDGPRGTPTIVGDKIYTEGGNGDVTCLSVEDGSTIWHVNLMTDFGGGRPGWGYSESALVVGDHVIVTPGGKDGTVVALNKETGDLVWRSNGISEGAHYATAVYAEIAGKPQIVQFARGSVFGLDPENGEFLWNYSGANNGTANCSSPIIHNDHVLVSSAYGTGTGMAKVTANPETGFKAEEKYFEKSLQSHHGGLVKYGDHVYGFSGGSLMCIDFMSGEIAWEDKSVRKGSVLIADGMIFALGEGHEVALVKAIPDEYVETGRFKIESLGRPSWAHPVVSNGKFYIRNQGRITCYDVAQ
ncbi:MAG: outer membrane protein assembly factor BamB/Ca2+-binding EF-hand superfamily protein [Verrucomicrobiales bacterium]|jgi:outer membrane protein assembly factor BamB/Ca2+-binding EF-hand superfamily protein